MTDTLNPDEVADTQTAVIDEGVSGVWPPIVDPIRLIPTLWRRLQFAREVLIEHGAEINAIETELGPNPSGARPTVAGRLAAIEQRLTALENP